MFSNDYEVFCAADGLEALEIIQTQGICLIISDQRMPGMCGVEMFKTVVRTPPHILRILLSGYIEKSDLQYALENNLIHKFMSKPWTVNELKKIVAEALLTGKIIASEQFTAAV